MSSTVEAQISFTQDFENIAKDVMIPLIGAAFGVVGGVALEAALTDQPGRTNAQNTINQLKQENQRITLYIGRAQKEHNIGAQTFLRQQEAVNSKQVIEVQASEPSDTNTLTPEDIVYPSGGAIFGAIAMTALVAARIRSMRPKR